MPKDAVAPAEPTQAEPSADPVFDDMVGGLDKGKPAKPAEPTPAEPTPAEPAPAPAEPTPAEPAPAEPAPAPASDSLFDKDFNGNDPEPAPAQPEPPAQKSVNDMTDAELEAHAQADESVGVDLGKIDDGPKKSIKDLVKQRDGARELSKTLEDQNSELKKQLESRPTSDRITELEEQNAQLKNSLGVHEVTSTQKWKDEVGSPKSETMSVINELATSYGIDQAEIGGIMNQKGKSRMDALKTNYPDFLEHIRPHLVTLDRIDIRDASIRKDHPKVLEEARTLQQEQARRVEVNKQELLKESVQTAISEATQRIPYFNPVDGDEHHNSRVENTMKLAKKIPEMNMQQILRLAVIGSSAQSYHEFSRETLSKNKELQTELDSLKGLTPGAEGSPIGNDVKKEKQVSEMSLDEYMDSALPE